MGLPDLVWVSPCQDPVPPTIFTVTIGAGLVSALVPDEGPCRKPEAIGHTAATGYNYRLSAVAPGGALVSALEVSATTAK